MRPQLNLEKCTEMITGCVCLQLRKATRVVTRLFDEMLQPCGLRSTQLPVLATLSVVGSTPIMRLADGLVMDRTSLTRLLRPLEIEGLIRISQGEDRRTKEVSITPRGCDAVATAIPLWEKAQSEVIGALGGNQLRQLHQIVAAIGELKLSDQQKLGGQDDEYIWEETT